MLVSEHSNNEGFANLESGLGKYRKKQLTKRAITKIITAVLFSYYTFKRFETIDIGAIIWYGLQIIIFFTVWLFRTTKELRVCKRSRTFKDYTQNRLIIRIY